MFSVKTLLNPTPMNSKFDKEMLKYVDYLCLNESEVFIIWGFYIHSINVFNACFVYVLTINQGNCTLFNVQYTMYIYSILHKYTLLIIVWEYEIEYINYIPSGLETSIFIINTCIYIYIYISYIHIYHTRTPVDLAAYGIASRHGGTRWSGLSEPFASGFRVEGGVNIGSLPNPAYHGR